MNQELYDYLHEHDFYLNRGEFRYCTEKYGKEEFRLTIAQYVSEKRPPFPFRELSYEDMVDNFQKLQKADYTKFITPRAQIDNEVLEKYDDYKYEFQTCGQGLIDTPSTYNICSDYFMNHLRLRCGSYGFKAPAQVWEEGTPKQIWSSIGGLWRGVNSAEDLSPKSVMEVLRLGTYLSLIHI